MSKSLQAGNKSCSTTNCEFFGSADFNGYCSKCSGKMRTYVRIRQTHFQSEENLKISFPRKSMKDHWDPEIYYTEQLKTRRNENASELIENFLYHFKGLNLSLDAENDIKYALKCVAGNIYQKFKSVESDSDICKIADIIQSSYVTLAHLMNRDQSNFMHLDHIQMEIILDTFERCIMGRIYHKVFNCKVDSQEDDEFNARREALKGLSPQRNLDLSISVYDADAIQMVFEAVQVLDCIYALLVPEEKVNYIVRCCRIIGEYFVRAKNKIVGADDLLPTLIFVALQANCMSMISNLSYIRRFRVQDKIDSGEGGYFFLLLTQALEIIKVGGAEQFLMDPEDFQDQLNCRKKKTSLWNIVISATHGFFFFEECKQQLPALVESSVELLDEMKSLDRDMDQLKVKFQSKMTSLQERTPLITLTRKTPSHIRAIVDEAIQAAATIPKSLPRKPRPVAPDPKPIKEPKFPRFWSSRKTKRKPRRHGDSVLNTLLAKLEKVMSAKHSDVVIDGVTASQEQAQRQALDTKIDKNFSDDLSVLSDTESNDASDLDEEPNTGLESAIFDPCSSDSDSEDLLIGDQEDYIEFLCRPCTEWGHNLRKKKVYFSKPEKR